MAMLILCFDVSEWQINLKLVVFVLAFMSCPMVSINGPIDQLQEFIQNLIGLRSVLSTKPDFKSIKVDHILFILFILKFGRVSSLP